MRKILLAAVGAALLAAEELGLVRWYRPTHNALLVPQRLFGWTYLNRDVMRSLRKLGLPVLVWTVNRADEMQNLLELGVDGIITDRPDILAGVLTRKAPVGG